MISRELFLEIFPQEEREILEEINTLKGAYSSLTIVGSYELFNDKKEHIGWRPKGANAYELVNICKQWAWGKGFEIYRGFDSIAIIEKATESLVYEMYADGFNPEYDFKACQWILDNK